MNSGLKKTFALVFRDPVSATIEWDSIERLLIGIGCRMFEGTGSRVRFELRGELETFHRPHPQKEAKRYQVRAARDFLTRLGMKP